MAKPLNFAVKLSIFRQLKQMTISQMASKVGVSPDRMEKLLDGDHEPRGGDIVRIMKRLAITFEPEDFDRCN